MERNYEFLALSYFKLHPGDLNERPDGSTRVRNSQFFPFRLASTHQHAYCFDTAALIGGCVDPGSLIPQRTQNPMRVREYFVNDPTLATWMDRLSLFDVYGSAWFSAIYILLFISLIGCVLPRSFEHLKVARALPPITPKNLDRMEFHHRWSGSGDELDLGRSWLVSKRFRIREFDGAISAEKGYLRETGNLFLPPCSDSDSHRRQFWRVIRDREARRSLTWASGL